MKTTRLPLLTMTAFLIWGMSADLGAVWAKPPAGEKTPRQANSKGEFSISPGQTINESLSNSDMQFEDNTYYDRYNLIWPGGDLTITLDSAEFDEYLIVYEPPGYPDGNRVDLDATTGTPPEVYQKTSAPAGDYTIFANSYEVETGAYSISVSAAPDGTPTPTPIPTASPTPTECPSPVTPSVPSPADGATDVPLDVTLSWNPNKSVPKVIYGTDDRMEVYEIQDPDLAQAVDAAVVMISISNLTDNGDGTFSLDSSTFNDYIQSTWSGAPLCDSEPYRLQPVPGSCSGFLVGEDLVVTAGHCVTSQEGCGTVAFIFGFEMIDANTPRLTIDSSEIYYCTELVGREFDSETGSDWSLLRMDRPVTGHTPLKIRRSGKIADNQSLILMGHPVGLPKKVAGNANVRNNNPEAYFVANLDSYGGNSGSAVLNAQTLEVEGVLVRGNDDFEMNGNCVQSIQCTDDGCTGESCTRTTQFAHLVPAPVTEEYTVFFGTCGSLNEVAKTSQTTYTPPTLSSGTTYCWQIRTTNSCGKSTLGPVWSFTTATDTAETPTPSPTATPAGPTELPTAIDGRADISGDGVVNAEDLLILLENWLHVVTP